LAEYTASELMPLAVEFLRRNYPGSLIVKELSIGNWGKAQIDVAAITEEFIVGIELKGYGDSPARLPLQVASYSKAARYMYLLCTPSLEKKCFKVVQGCWVPLLVNGGVAERRYRYGLTPQVSLAPGQLLQCMIGKELKQACKEAELPYKKATKIDQWTKMLLEALPLPRIEKVVCKALRDRDWHKWAKSTGRDFSERVFWA